MRGGAFFLFFVFWLELWKKDGGFWWGDAGAAATGERIKENAKRSALLVGVDARCVLGVNGFGGPMVMGGLDSVDRWKERKSGEREWKKERKKGTDGDGIGKGNCDCVLYKMGRESEM